MNTRCGGPDAQRDGDMGSYYFLSPSLFIDPNPTHKQTDVMQSMIFLANIVQKKLIFS